MTPSRWRQTKEALSRVLALAPEARDACLKETCENPSLRADVKSLLRHEDNGRGPLAPFTELAGQSLGHYQVIEKIGQGAAGTVYKAFDTRLDRFVVVKVLPAPLMADEESQRRFLQEAKCLSALNHPNIVAIHDLGHDKGMTFLVMEFVPGRTLTAAIPRRGLRCERYLAYARQIAEALAAAHSAGIVHRDLKPSNILITDDHRVKIVDFGLAKTPVRGTRENNESLTLAGTILGTPGYMSPEQVRGKIADVRSDIFSFGVIVHQMITGKAPFARSSSVETMAAILKDPPPALSQKVPPDIGRITKRCLRKHPTERYQSVQEIVEQLNDTLPATRPAARSSQSRHAIRGRVRWELAFIVPMVMALGMISKGTWQSSGHELPSVPATSNTTPVMTVVVSPFTGEEGEWVTSVLTRFMQHATDPEPDIEVWPLRKPLAWDGNTVLDFGPGPKNPILLLWGETQRGPEHTFVAAHLGFLGHDIGFPCPHTMHTLTFAYAGRNPSPIEQGFATQARYVTLLLAGVTRFQAHATDSAIEVLSRIAAEPAPDEIVDPGVSRFYRGLAYFQRVSAGPCERSTAAGCDLDRTLKDVRSSIEDFDAILRRHPDHAGALWNRGLAREELCELQSHVGDTAPDPCEGAIRDFTNAIRPVAFQKSFFTQLPDEASALFNRGYTHLLLARFTTLNRDARRAEFAAAIRDFEGVLAGGARYAPFLNKRREDVVEQLQVAREERSTLMTRRAL